MQLNELNILSSERGVRSALRSVFYGARSQLITACANIKVMQATVDRLRRDGYQDRAEQVMETPRYTTLKTAIDNAAIRCASIDALANSLGVALDTDLTPQMAGGKTKEQMRAVAEATGIDEEKLAEIERKGIKQRYEREVDAQTDAEVAFYSSEADDEVDVKAETVLRAFERERNRMLEWTNLDLGELTLMRHDIEVLTRLSDAESRDDEVEQTEGSIDGDVAEQLAPKSSLSSIYESYKKEITQVRENQKKLEALEMKAAAAGNPPTKEEKADSKKGGRRVSKDEHDSTANK